MDRIGAGDDIEHTGRKTRFGRELTHVSAHQRRVRRGLQDDRAAGEQRCDHLADVDVERHVPGRDRADDADRFVSDIALGVEAVFAAHAAVLFKLHQWETFEQSIRPEEGAVHLGPCGGADGCASLVTRNVDQLLAVRVKQIAILLHELESIGVVPRPVGVVERLAGRNDRGIDVFFRGVGGFADDVASPRADVVVRLVACCAADDAVDIKFRFWERGHKFIL